MVGLAHILDFAAAVYAFYLLKRLFSKRPPLPPGPRGQPLVGNLRDFFHGYNWHHWGKYKGLYGPVSSLSFLGQNVIVLNDQKSSLELLEKRSHKYSDRPSLVFADMCVWPFSAILLLLIFFGTGSI